MIAFTELVFDQMVRNANSEVLSSAKFDELLGSAYDLTLEVEVEESSGGSPTITVNVHHSNSARGFVSLASVISAASIASPPYRSLASQGGPFGKFVRIGVVLGGTSPTARVRVWATGRTHG